MNTIRLSGPRGTLRIDNEVIPVHYLSDLDANWRYTDAAGHEHYCAYEAPDHYPTLTEVIEETYWCCDCNDEHEKSHLACRQCGEQITPGRTGPGTKYISAGVICTFNGEVITRAEADRIVAQWRSASQ